ncbi:MAG: FAD binding domain-containing protein [Candidatus Cloacimonetes bacterium]|nr:FAD binding domain-containing protein [Candidatus Cloacimonadota bacterium]
MRFFKPSSLPELFLTMENFEGEKYFLAGGTDLNIQKKKNLLQDRPVFYINHLTELKGIRELHEDILIGSLTSFREILDSQLLNRKLPFLQNSLAYFASPLLQTMATVGGNIANASPTADILPLLLVLDARVKLLSKSKFRELPISEFYLGYKQTILKSNEIIGGIIIPKTAETGFQTYYRKVGSRKALTIAKLAFAGLKKTEQNNIKIVKIAVGALNEFPRRLRKLEELITGKYTEDLKSDELRKILESEITPITDLRSDSDYRFEVTLNLLLEFLEE